ncbi:RapZ C-terminal domain-containing protein [Phaeacidiphilus oryzae]|uniref:RapZ C-terminal domain-containing protein n=1 Tax=Phaeacidiphilus oryzae TaxID=348818 RepID=UPI0007C8336A|nr:RNase adapter RapZ [Phaeacidiphilus oryzae]
MTDVEIVSFGYLHADEPPEAHLTVDLREHFRDPHFDPRLRHLTADDPRVYEAVTTTPGIVDLLSGLAGSVLGFVNGPSAVPVVVALGCAGGRHRAPAIAKALALRLTAAELTVAVHHRDVGRPVVNRPQEHAGGRQGWRVRLLGDPSAVARHRQARREPARVDRRDRAETPAFLAANDRVIRTEKVIPWWRR